MDSNKLFQSKSFMAVIWIVAVIALFLLVFLAGMYVGFKKAGFSYQWGENYHRNFAGPKQGFGDEFGGKDLIDAHGTFGQILKIDNSALIVKGINNVEKIILVNNKTIINRFRDNIKLSDLKVDEKIVTIGDPDNSGQIVAKLIRVLPDQPPLPPNVGNNPLPGGIPGVVPTINTTTTQK